jgi:hypothetical protein
VPQALIASGTCHIPDEAIVRLHILPFLGDRRLKETTPPDIQKLVNDWAKQQAPRTARRQYDVLRALFAYAVASDWIARPPCRGIDLPSVEALRRPQLGPHDYADPPAGRAVGYGHGTLYYLTPSAGTTSDLDRVGLPGCR